MTTPAEVLAPPDISTLPVARRAEIIRLAQQALNKAQIICDPADNRNALEVLYDPHFDNIGLIAARRLGVEVLATEVELF